MPHIRCGARDGKSDLIGREAPRPVFSKTGRGLRSEIPASFLQSNVQGDPATAREFLDEIAAAERGEEPQPGGVGNAFSIAIAPDGATTRNTVLEGEMPERNSLGEMRAALDTSIAAIECARRNPGEGGCSPSNAGASLLLRP